MVRVGFVLVVRSGDAVVVDSVRRRSALALSVVRPSSDVLCGVLLGTDSVDSGSSDVVVPGRDEGDGATAGADGLTSAGEDVMTGE